MGSLRYLPFVLVAMNLIFSIILGSRFECAQTTEAATAEAGQSRARENRLGFSPSGNTESGFFT